jgi:hypothetical protein
MSQGSMSGQEERDALFARLFGLTSVLQSGLLLRSSSSSSSDVPADLSSFEEWLMDILAVGMKKSWLRESAGWTLLSAVSALAEATVPWREDAKTLLVRQIFIEDKVWTPEKVAILLKCQDEWKGMEWSDVTKGAWKHGNVLHSSNYGALARVLKVRAYSPQFASQLIMIQESEADDADESKKLSTGTWKPQLHFVWDILLDCILPTSATASTHKAGSVQEFFRIVVDGRCSAPGLFRVLTAFHWQNPSSHPPPQPSASTTASKSSRKLLSVRMRLQYRFCSLQTSCDVSSTTWQAQTGICTVLHAAWRRRSRLSYRRHPRSGWRLLLN